MGFIIRKKTAFTLIELLVVIAIISLLVSILLPSLNRAKDLAKSVICGSNLHSIGVTLHLYSDEYDEKLPPPPSGQNCNAYWFYASTLGGFQNLGYLAGAELLDHQSGLVICPAWDGVYHSNSNGDHAHENCCWGAGASGLLPEDASLKWTHIRSSYCRRRYDLEGNVIETLSDLGSLGLIGDVFLHPDHLDRCHGDGINVWYGDSHVEYRPIDSEELRDIFDSGDFDTIWELIGE